MEQTIWQCEQWRAGQRLNKLVFDTREEADAFVRKMGSIEPDIFWSVEPVEARTIWN